MKRLIAISVGLLLCGGDARAQPSAVEVGQISSATNKVDSETVAGIVPVPAPGEDAQLTSERDRTLIAPSPEAKDAARSPVQQLTRGRPSAESAPALSRREQSRPGAREVLEGTDRCDPAERRARTAECARVIENRSAEFDRRPAPLSPEQRLLLEQQVVIRDGAYERASRRLANNGTGDSGLDEQAVASVVLGRNVPPPAPKKNEEDKDAGLTQAQAEAIVGAILNQPPPR